ncbi:hypothetical protein AJ80_08320 [Polytolypa hystricis UAMH7299]|uniref:Uncharacterized protein n=1 Tax=Polytolypa hystricis (strain UAMH7299) TaxID=1447883 RepID=A0A2B7XAF3_POLH7|nr:hypothetical protein AJ80_08320 [Polytolypa hystricis UAMH7299]
MANSSSTPDGETVRRALESARNSENGHIDARVNTILNNAINELWRRVQAQPDSFVLSRDEFALFNYFQDRFRGSTVAQRAVERFWNNFQGSPSDIDGYTQRESC